MLVVAAAAPVVPDEAIDAMRAANTGSSVWTFRMQATTFIWTTPPRSIASCWHF